MPSTTFPPGGAGLVLVRGTPHNDASRYKLACDHWIYAGPATTPTFGKDG